MFTASLVTTTKGRLSSPHHKKRSSRLVSIIGATAIALLGLTTSDVGATESGARAVLENHACAMVLGLNPSEVSYDACIRSLDNTLSRADDTQAVVNIHDACAKQGFNPGTSAFATCLDQAGKSPAKAGRNALNAQ